MESIMGPGRWILAGDYNMVELSDDSKGKSALLSGAEARAWKQLALTKGVVDAYLCSVARSGGLYTRQAFCDLRLDGAQALGIGVDQGPRSSTAGETYNDGRAQGDSRPHARSSLTQADTQEEEHPQLVTLLKHVEENLRKREHEEVRSWRMRSREWWLREGEAPTRYFYAQTKARFCRKAIQSLENDNGVITTDRALTMQQVHDYYKNLYTREETT
ncbi:hypothetical protein R1sor_017903 [Riccia sorocarpa]|uniref:Uncharacterized protein n=1 Tax=Riccia sorocarpa TaxID=122646 RepID=A0ABD3IC58_9MARC